VLLGDVQLTAGVVADLLAGRVGQVFLKQFRDTTDGTRACYQTIVEAPVQIRRVQSTLSERDWHVKLHPLDSHPIDRELGLAEQDAEAAFDIAIDFVVENGHEVGGPGAVSGAPPVRFPAPGAGGGSLIEAAARWFWHELTELERASLDWLRRI
jgi:hypothetical protein